MSVDVSTIIHKGQSTLIYRALLDDDEGEEMKNEIHTAKEKRRGSIAAVKVLTDPSELPSLNNEYNILRSLPLSCGSAVRRALKRGKLNKIDAIYLEFIDGISLEDWLKKKEQTIFDTAGCLFSRSDVLERTRIIRYIASSLACIHEVGIVHNDVTAQNIIIKNDVDDDLGEKSLVSLIDFGYATRDEHLELNDDGYRANDDLPALASLVGKIFGVGKRKRCGSLADDEYKRHEDEEEEDGQCEPPTSSSTFSSPTHTSSLDFSITGEDSRDLPRSIWRILRDLEIDTSNTVPNGCIGNLRYQSSRELEEDLTQMLEHPKLFLFDPPSLTSAEFTSSLIFRQRRPRVLHGLVEETEVLLRLCDHVDDPNRTRTEVVIIRGPSGTGKTSLIQKAREARRGRDGYFVVGKFDQLQGAEPYSALVVAFNEICQFILEGDSNRFEIIRANVKTALGSHGKVLTDVIPQLTNIIGEQPHVPELGAMEAKNRFKHAIQSFLYAICTLSSCPIVFALDDMQWADEPSIELVETMLTDMRNSHFLFIGCYRDDDMNTNPQVAMEFEEMEGKDVSVNTIKLKNMNVEAVTNLISERLRLTRRYTRSLGDIVHRRTLGNPLFVSQFLSSLCNDGILCYSPKHSRWMWDEVATEEKTISDDVVELMTEKIMTLENEQQRILMSMSCIGSHFDKSTFLNIFPEYNNDEAFNYGESSSGINKVLKSLAKEGLIEKTRVRHQYKFSHDRFQQAAYSLFPTKSERGKLHFRIGRYLIEKHNTSLDPSTVFAAADQLNRGMKQCTAAVSTNDLLQLVTLNTKAAERAVMASAFVPAKAYANTGMALLQRDHDLLWGTQYHLTLRLHHILVEADYCLGSFDTQTRNLADAVFLNARHYHDKVPVYFILVLSLSAQQSRVKEALSIGLDILQNLGEPIPKSASTCNVLIDFLKTKRMMRGKTNEFFCNLPQMTDKGKVYAMEALLQVSTNAFLVKSNSISALCCFRGVQLTLRHGLTKYACSFLSSYAFVLICILGDYKGAYRLGDLTETLLNIFAKDQIAKVRLTLYTLIFHWRDHLRCTLNPLLESYHIGLEAGDIESAIYGAGMYCRHYVWSGQQLKTLIRKLEMFCQKARDTGQTVGHDFLLSAFQMVHNLMGKSKDPVRLTGDIVANEEDYFKRLESSKSNEAGVKTTHIILAYLSYLFGNYKLAAEHSKMSEDFFTAFPGGVQGTVQVLYDGLTSFALARETKSMKWRRRGRQKLNLLKKWAKVSPQNFTHKLLFLKAENAALNIRSKSRLRKAENIFKELIAAAEKSGYIHEEALAYERASILYNTIGKKDVALSFNVRSRELYLKWGAKGKADDLMEKIKAERGTRLMNLDLSPFRIKS